MKERRKAMSEKTVPVKTEKDVPATREEERYLKPPVDIYETDKELVVVTDMPGVGQENVDVGVDSNILTISGKVKHDSNGNETYREFTLLNYFRQFELSEEVDQEKISAGLKNGVLTITLPKMEKAKPKQITVKVN